jgi:predicted dehydrogenase
MSEFQGTSAQKRIVSRRGFVAAAAAGATLSIVAPRNVRGAEANERIRAGVVGLGGRGGWIADHIAGHPGFEVTAVADYFPNVVRAAGERLKVPKARRFSGLDGYKGLMESGVEAVFLETPPYFFPQHARAAVATGCHVYVAKPVAVDVPGSLEILELGSRCTRAGKVFLVDFQTRTDPFHIEAVRRVHAGTIGKLGLLSSFYHDECFADPPRETTVENLLSRLAWVNDTALGGSYIVNCDIHALDVALWLSGQVPVSAVGHSHRGRPNARGDSHDCYAITYRLPSGAVISNRSEHIRNQSGFLAGCHAHGETGLIETQYGGAVRIVGGTESYPGGECPDLYAEGMTRNVDVFHRSIREGDTANPTVKPSVDSTLATILGREAALHKREITWKELLEDTRRLEVDVTGLRV